MQPLSRPGIAAWPMLVAGAIVLLGWDIATWATELWHARGISLPVYFYREQDRAVLAFQALALLALLPFAGGRQRPGALPAPPSGWTVAILMLAMVVAARLGRSLVFHDYSMSRDEIMAELAGAYLAEGRLGWPIPPIWHDYARAILPEFASPYGASDTWTAIYLPVHAAIRTLFVRLGDADMAGPAMLLVGLAALWDVAGRILPGRPDARLVVLLMAVTSTQLLATAMTPYAMTSHFALDMLWLALVLRRSLWAEIAAALLLVAMAGLHQWHFPILFAGPFTVWLFWQRRWRAGLLQAGGMGLSVLLWARLWPTLLEHVLGPPVGGAKAGAPGVHAKVASLFRRLDRWQPLLNIGRLIAWNNVLLLPMAALAAGLVPRSWRGWRDDPPVMLPLMATVLLGFAFAMYQGYGWGFRYMHGQVGALCLLAGQGWCLLSREGRRPLTLVWASVVVALVTSAFLLVTTEHYARGYARTMAAIRGAPVDVVLVDLRGGFYMTDLVRFEQGRPGRPMVMAMTMLTDAKLRRLCATHSVAVMDYPQFWALGVHRVNPRTGEGPRLDALRATMAEIDCGQPVIPPRR